MKSAVLWRTGSAFDPVWPRPTPWSPSSPPSPNSLTPAWLWTTPWTQSSEFSAMVRRAAAHDRRSNARRPPNGRLQRNRARRAPRRGKDLYHPLLRSKVSVSPQLPAVAWLPSTSPGAKVLQRPPRDDQHFPTLCPKGAKSGKSAVIARGSGGPLHRVTSQGEHPKTGKLLRHGVLRTANGARGSIWRRRKSRSWSRRRAELAGTAAEMRPWSPSPTATDCGSASWWRCGGTRSISSRGSCTSRGSNTEYLRRTRYEGRR